MNGEASIPSSTHCQRSLCTLPSNCQMDNSTDEVDAAMLRRQTIGCVINDLTLSNEEKHIRIQKVIDMAELWDSWARDIVDMPLPQDLRSLVDIQCGDCFTTSTDRQWHFIGVQCPKCTSFDTIVMDRTETL